MIYSQMIMGNKKSVAIIGAGLSGLACATHLQDFEVHIFDELSEVGGRVYTDHENGYLLDRGFQVYLPAYEEGKKIFDYPSLNFKKFSAGARIRIDGKFYEVGDPLRDPSQFFSTLTAPIGSFFDKLKILQLKISRPSSKATSTIDYLNEMGFSEDIIENFFRPFFSGIFLERELATPAHFFQYLYGIFSSCYASVPELGMQQLPLQLKDRITSAKFIMGTKVDAFNQSSVTINGEQQKYDYVVQAFADSSESFHSVVTDYFTTDFKVDKPILYLNASNDDVINHIAPMSAVSNKYAPPGKNLLSVNLIGNKQDTDVEQVKRELLKWFPNNSFTHLKRYHVKKSLPINAVYGQAEIVRNGIYHCGDQMQSPSINGALLAGRLVAGQFKKST